MAVSCQKENALEPGNYTKFETDVINLPVSVENNTLVFETEQDFQRCLDLLKDANLKQLGEFEKALNFSSYRTQHQESIDENDPNFSDELFLSIINPDAEIIIARNLFRVDFDNEKTIVSPVNNNNSLKSGNNIVFDWNEDIFEYLETGQRNLLKASYCTSNSEKSHTWTFGQPGYDAQVKAIVRFSKFGFYSSIYFSLEQTVWHDYTPIISGYYTTIGENYYRRKRGGKVPFSRIKPNTILSPNGKIYNRPYGPSTRRLKEYRVNVKFNVNFTDNGQYYSYHKTLLIECHK